MPNLLDNLFGPGPNLFGGGPDPYPSVEGESAAIDAVLREVERGLPNEYEARINDAIRNQEFYDGDMAKHLRYREAETPWDHEMRRKRLRLLTRRVVDVLCEHLYNPGPQRRLEGSRGADAWLAEQYARNHIDALMQEADRLCTLNDVAALKVAASGNEGTVPGPDSGLAAPIRIQLYGAEEFAVWCQPDDPVTPWVVATIDRHNEQRRVQVWTERHYWTYASRPVGLGQTSGGRILRLVPEQSGDNPYGTLPFAFVHYSLPVRRFWTEGPGTAIRRANEQVNQESTDLAAAVQFYGSPQAFCYNTDPAWRPIVRPGGISRVPADRGALMNGGPPPRVEYLQPSLDIAGIQADIESFVSGVLEDHGIPRSAVRLEQSASASGVALVAEQLPLLTRAKRRRRIFTLYESRLAEVCLRVAGAYYGLDALAEAAASPRLQLTWPRIEIPIPGPDQDNADLFELDQGFASKVGIMMRRHGLTRPQALAELRQIARDQSQADRIERKAAASGPGAAEPSIPAPDFPFEPDAPPPDPGPAPASEAESAP